MEDRSPPDYPQWHGGLASYGALPTYSWLLPLFSLPPGKAEQEVLLCYFQH